MSDADFFIDSAGDAYRWVPDRDGNAMLQMRTPDGKLAHYVPMEAACIAALRALLAPPPDADREARAREVAHKLASPCPGAWGGSHTLFCDELSRQLLAFPAAQPESGREGRGCPWWCGQPPTDESFAAHTFGHTLCSRQFCTARCLELHRDGVYCGQDAAARPTPTTETGR